MNWPLFVRFVRKRRLPGLNPDNPDCAHVKQSPFSLSSYLLARICVGPVFVRFVRIGPDLQPSGCAQ